MELETSEVENVTIKVEQMKGESQAFLLDAMRSMLVEVKRDNGRSECGSRGELRRGRTHCCRAESSRGKAYCCTRDDFS